MKRVMMLALFAAACGSTSPTAPSPAPLPEAVLVLTLSITMTACQGVDCAFSGYGTNVGQGCATNIAGIITTYAPGSNSTIPIDRAAFTVGTVKVRPHENFSYSGPSIRVAPQAGWTAYTTFTWTNTSC